MRFGVQTALQDTDPDELLAVWRRADELGFDWISVWDHFYAVGGGTRNLEAVAMHAALATATTRARCGGLVYSVGYRDVAVLANAIATIDHLSHGRATLGLGAGYLQAEYDAWGIPFPSARDRLDRLAETVEVLRPLLRGESVTHHGRHVHLTGAVCDPPSRQARLPIWIGGGGEQRTIPMAARLADGWNVPMATLDDFARKAALLDRCAAEAGRDPADLERSVGLGLCWDPERLTERFGERAPQLSASILSGSTDQVVDRVAAYGRAGADLVIVSLRAPFEVDELERFAAEVVPELRGSTPS